MKYSDRQRVEKIIATADRLSQYLDSGNITRDKVMDDYSVQWTVTTPLYNIGEQTYHLSAELKDRFPDARFPACATALSTITRERTGASSRRCCSVIYRRSSGSFGKYSGLFDLRFH